MPNKHYIRGRQKERRIRRQLLDKEGFDFAVRSAGSKSPIDVWAVRKADKVVLLVQAKPDDFNSEKLMEEMDWLNGKFEVRFEVR